MSIGQLNHRTPGVWTLRPSTGAAPTSSGPVRHDPLRITLSTNVSGPLTSSFRPYTRTYFGVSMKGLVNPTTTLTIIITLLILNGK